MFSMKALHHSRTVVSLRTFLALFLLMMSVLTLNANSVSAQAAGVRITPAVIEESLDPGTVKEYTVSIENLDGADHTFYIFTRDISDVQSGGVPIFAEDDDEKTGYELSDWISLPVSEIQLAGNGKTNISFTISVPDTASPGSHFGGVFISVDPPKMESSGAAVGYQVANIISLRVSGDAIEQANIRQFSTTKFLYGSQNVDFLVRIENEGNVLVRPTGPLEIINMLGNKVGTVIFNESRKGVFPKVPNPSSPEDNGVREFQISWQGDAIGFGRYEAILSPSYGDQGAKKTMSSTVSFWILPWNIIGPALGVLAFILILVFVFVRLYIRRSLAHLSQGRGLVRRRNKKGTSTALLFVVVMLTVTALFLIVLLAIFA